MVRHILIAHAPGEESIAELLAGPIRGAGYEVVHRGTMMVGESINEEASKVIQSGGPIVVCGTVRALGTGWAYLLVNAARQHNNTRIFAVQMEKDAYLQPLSSDSTIALFWQDPAKAVNELIAALAKHYPATQSEHVLQSHEAERRYRELALESCDIIDLANLPESDRYLATRQLELRRLYVPLRVRVEIGSDGVASEDSLKDIERRRDASRRLFNWDIAKNKGKTAEPSRIPVGHRLSEAQRLIVLGDPGSGKTTLVRWIATSYLLRLNRNPEWKVIPDVSSLPDHDWLPVIIRCRDLDHNSLQGPLDQILTHTFRRAELSNSEAIALLSILKEKLVRGQALILIDGLDEIVDPVLRIRFCQQLEQIRVAYPKASIIVTSRIVGYKELGYRIGRGFEHVTLVDLSKEEKEDFARRWCALTEAPERRADVTAELIHDIHSTDRIERLTANPMLLTTLALVKRKIGSLPSRRADLYWDALEVLLNWRREVDEPIDQREAVPQLQYLAYAMCERGIAQMREDEVIELLEQMREEYPQIHSTRKHSVEEFVRLMERRTGILIESGHVRHLGRPIPLFEFRHLTFQEYLAGLALVDGRFPQRNRERSLAENIAILAGQTSEVNSSAEAENDESGSKEPEITVADNWREAIRLCVASCNDDDVDATLLSILTPLEGENTAITERSRAVIATLCLADDPNASEEIAHQVLRQFVEHINKKDGTGLVKTSVDVATKEVAGSRWATALYDLLLTKFVLGEDWETRNAYGTLTAIAAMTEIPEGESAIRQWLAQKASEVSLDDNSAAAGAALQVMMLAYQKRVYYHVPELVSGLLRSLDTGAPTAYAAAWALNWINKDKVSGRPWQPTSTEVHTIIDYLRSPLAHARVAEWLIYVLGRERASQAVEILLSKLNDADVKVRKAACDALGLIGDRTAVDSLIERLGDESEVQTTAIESLGRLGDERSIDVVVDKLEDNDRKIRQAAAFALGWMGKQSAVNPLIDRLDDSDTNVRQAVVESLGRLQDSRVVPLLVTRLQTEHEDERNAAAWALGRIGDERAVDPLMASLSDPSKKVRRQIVVALRRFKNANVSRTLVACLRDEDVDLQSAAAMVLGWMKDSGAVEPLIERLSCKNDARPVVIRSLGLIGDKRAAKALIKMLDDESPEVRVGIIDALAQIADGEAVGRILEQLEDSNVEIKTIAAAALGHLGHVETVELLSANLEGGTVDDKKLVVDAVYGLAVHKFKLGDVEGAVELFELATSTAIEGEYYDLLHNNAAYCHILLNRYEEAAQHFEAMEFSRRHNGWPLFQHNLGVLSFLMGDIDKARKDLLDALEWMRVDTNHNPTDVAYMLVLRPDGQVFSCKDLPIDAGALINLYTMGALSRETVIGELERTYRSEYREWSVLNEVGLSDNSENLLN